MPHDEGAPGHDRAELSRLPRRSAQGHLEPQLREVRGSGEGTPFTPFAPVAEQPVTERPAAERAATEPPGAEGPPAERPGTERPGTERPGTGRPAAGRPLPERQAAERETAPEGGFTARARRGRHAAAQDAAEWLFDDRELTRSRSRTPAAPPRDAGPAGT